MLVAQGKNELSAKNHESDSAYKRVKGYDFKFAKWEDRYQKELAAGKIVQIDS